MSAAAANPLRRVWKWGLLFFVNMALIALAHIFGLIEPPAPWILLALNMVLLVPYVRAAKDWQEAKGAMSPALRRYNRRMLGFGAVYMVAMIAGGSLADALAQGSPAMWAAAVVPIAPVLGMIWAMFRYLREEDDEYLRHRAVTGALAGLALVLVLGTSWGFLEMFGLVPHVWNWWVFPAWAIGLGIGMCWPRDDTGAES